MAPRAASSTTATAAIPAALRFLINTLEPVFAFSGAVLLLVKPEQYLSSLTHGQGAAFFEPSQQWVYTQLAGGWFLIVFLEAVILRLVDDLRIWRLALGGWSVWLDIPRWTLEDWTVSVTTWPFVLTRMAIVLGVGLNGPQAPRKP